MTESIISVSIPPFPDFIEGNFTVFRKGQKHPKRTNLGYFDLIIVKSGCLFLEENGIKYEVKEKELFLLLPDSHHCSWKPCEEETSFYWIHFYTTAQWRQGEKPGYFISDLPIPELHYHQRSYTLHLLKHAPIRESEVMFELVQDILESTVGERISNHPDGQDGGKESNAADPAGERENPLLAERNTDIWRTEELFLRFLKMLENQGIYQNRLTLLAEQVHLFLEKNLEKDITNAVLEEQFHLHSNYIARAMKATFGRTALEVLFEIRIRYAKQYLIRTNYDLQTIAKVTGFSSEIYFSNCFKKSVGMAPRDYRKKYS